MHIEGVCVYDTSIPIQNDDNDRGRIQNKKCEREKLAIVLLGNLFVHQRWNSLDRKWCKYAHMCVWVPIVNVWNVPITMWVKIDEKR